MWEIPVYLLAAPLITIAVTLISALKYQKYAFGPICIFIAFNIPTILLPMLYNVGWEALFGWAIAYTLLSLLITLIVKLSRKKTVRT